MNQYPFVLRVTSTPPGEAPEWVRQKWVGLSLPLAQKDASARNYFTSEVLSGPKGLFSCLLALCTGKIVRKPGYAVESLKAIQILEAAHPEAGAWWRANTPELLDPRRSFVFQLGVGHVEENESPASDNS